MQKNVQTRSSFPWTGSHSLEGLQSLFQGASSTPERLVRPDSFDERGRWHRLVEIDGTQVAFQLDPSGIFCWGSQERMEQRQIQRALDHLFLPLPFPKKAGAHLPEALATRFLRHSPLVHLASASLGEALIKAILRQVISAPQAKKLLHRFIVE